MKNSGGPQLDKVAAVEQLESEGEKTIIELVNEKTRVESDGKRDIEKRGVVFREAKVIVSKIHKKTPITITTWWR